MELKRVLDRFQLDAAHWSENVQSYGRMFYRIIGPLQQLVAYARRRGQHWFRGQSGSKHLYRADSQLA